MKPRSLVAAVLSSLGLSTLVQYEGYQTEAYQDGANIWTICFGHTKGVYRGMTATRAECDAFLRADLMLAEAFVRSVVTVPLTQHQYDALILFTYNVGIGNFKTSTLLRKLNAGDYVGASNEFPKWNKIRDPKTGLLIPSRGLTNRRAAEQNLFLKDFT